MTQPNPAGLEDVVAGTSEICFIDGKEGRLLYRGYDVRDLAEHASFEEVVYLLWHGRLPNRAQLDAFVQQLRSVQALPGQVLDLIQRIPPATHPMAALRTAVSYLGTLDPDQEDQSQEANLRRATRLVAQFPTLVAAIERVRQGKEPVAPRRDLPLAANFLYMLRGEEPSPLHAEVMNVALVLHADHELNASTFAARVVAATLSDMYSAITAAVGALKGPLHGGANEQVMRTLLAIGSPDKAEAWVKEALAAKKRIMGFGHRVYKTEDPRATILRRLSRKVAEAAGDTRWFEISQAVEKVVAAEKGLYPNVDFYSASTYYVMGIPFELYTPIFAVSRISGWTAHVLEQFANNRLIRPRAEYTGPTRREWVPLDQR
ncbi:MULTISPECIES: citrate synthase [Thermaerobacter]|uniref:Citrate synthase n=1 Tax=Thermaerobacter subterraneus DSM 13965 TaxID=867903 RepID=K6Q3X6_9FIRM|nr:MULTISPECIES: citrate synthase [Thermaerobacter]EKP95814.1 citrate synthase [Thermaerobacter subterraneus DSM 13965]QIA27214.1 citrate synthase [Thermaerobacter sp. PB12/4term]